MNPTAFEVDGRIIEALQQCTAVGRDHHCGAQFVELFEQAHELDADPVVDIAGRLIGEQQMGAIDHRAGDGDPLLLTAAELLGSDIGVLTQADPVQQFMDVVPVTLPRLA